MSIVCKLCNSGNIEKNKIGNVELFHCHECDITYNADSPDKEILDDYYRKDYVIQDNINLLNEQRRIFRLPEQIELIKKISSYKEKGTILDIGCDRGFFIDEARRHGYYVHGVEPSETAQEYISTIGLQVSESLDEQKNNKFDIITLFHVLEHFPEPKNELNKIKELMNDNSLIFIRVPDFNTIWRKIFKAKWIWFQPKNHYFHYSMKSLIYLLESSGFEILEIESRKPNNKDTKRMFNISKSIFSKNRNINLSILDRVKRSYEDLTGIELACIAKYKN